MTKYEQHQVENVGDYTEWIRPIRKGYKMACCDCNLVHDLDFRVRKEFRGLVIEFRARRNSKETKKLRKEQEK
jgi:hypothetical protein